jgi:hypothetical protein
LSQASTQQCQKFGQAEISVCYEDSSFMQSNVRWLLQWIESEVASGRRFLPEQTVQVGWSLLQIRLRDDGALSLFEPDFESMPVKFVDGVSRTLMDLFIQKSVAESLGLEEKLDFPSLRQSAIVCTEFGAKHGFVMSRAQPEENDSGWFFGCDNPEHDHQQLEVLQRVSVYEAAVRMEPRIIPFLALPQGAFVGFGAGIPYFSVDDREISIRPGTYLFEKHMAVRN